MAFPVTGRVRSQCALAVGTTGPETSLAAASRLPVTYPADTNEARQVLASIPSAIVIGVDGRHVTVEVHVGKGIPGLSIVGLPDAACREARDRVRAAVMAAGATWPNLKITINLAPSDTRKVGSGLDLAMAVGVLVASEQLRPELVEGLAFIGELGWTARPTRPRGVTASRRRPTRGGRSRRVTTPTRAWSHRARGAHAPEVVAAVSEEERAWPDHPGPCPTSRSRTCRPDEYVARHGCDATECARGDTC